MDQEPYPNQEDGCTKGMDGSRYQLLDVLGVGEVRDPWKTPKKKMKCSGNEDKSKKSSRQWRFLVKMKSRSGTMVWKVARGDEGEG